MIRTIIADDEPAARAKLRRLLGAHSDINIVGEASTGLEVIDLVRAHRPALLFLDMRMPEVDGLAALGTFDEEVRPMVVFVTAFDEYAVRAFVERAVDFLLKPFDGPRLAATLARVRAHIELEQRPSLRVVRELIERAQRDARSPATADERAPTDYLTRVVVRSTGRTDVFRVSDIEWIEAAGNYVRLHTAAGRPLFRQTMRELAERLDPSQFVRIHRGALVNLDAVERMEPLASGDYLVRLRSGARVRMSRSYRAAAISAMEALRGP